MSHLPKGWRRVLLGDLGSFKNGLNKEKDEFGHGCPFVNLMDVFGRAVLDETRFGLVNSTTADRLSYCLEKGDVLFVRSSVKPEGVGLTTVVLKDLPQTTYSGFLIRYRPDNSIEDSFKAHCFSSGPFRRELLRRSTISANTNINQEELNQLPLILPPKHEQEKISAILNHWDKAIDRLAAIVRAKGERRRGVMQQLLSGKKRFRKFVGERWRTVRIGDLLQEISRYVEFDDDHLYKLASIRRRSEGLFFREELRGNAIKTKVMKTIRAGDFLLSKMQVVHGAWGLVTQRFDGMFVSDSYIALVPRDPNRLKVEFFNYLSQTRHLRQLAYLACHGVHIEKMTFHLDEFLNETITIPPTDEEQQSIVGVLSACDREIELLQDQLDAVQEQKRGLMQKLLTGQIRVNASRKN